MKDIMLVDPQRITERIFGGPHFLMCKTDGEFIYSGGNKYTPREIAAAWSETRNARPVQEA